MVPPGPAARPAVVTWFKVYAVTLLLLYVAVAAMSLVFFLVPTSELEMERTEAIVIGSIFLAMGLLFAAACVPPLLGGRRPWVWVYGIVLICMGMTSACFLPACIPLLIFWLKPEAKAYYGKD